MRLREVVPINELKPHPKNRNEHPADQIARLAQVIEYQGFRHPVIVSNLSGFIVAGHGRLAAAQKLKLKEVPVDFQDFENEEQEYAFLISDNAVALWAELDIVGINQDLADLGPDFDIDWLGIKDFTLDVAEKGEKSNNLLSEKFLVPPLSVLDTKQGYWQERKRKWMDEIGDFGESRENALKFSKLMNKINNGVSILDPVLAETMLHWFSFKDAAVLDPFAGDSVFGYVAKKKGGHFIGIELRKEQAELNQKRCDLITIESDPESGSAVYKCDSSENLNTYVKDESIDFLFSCPPYFDLEVYSDLPNDLSNQDSYEDFRDLIAGILTNSVKKLKKDRFACITITEIRDQKTGLYRNFVPDIIEIMNKAGAKFYNELILLNAIANAAMRAEKYMETRKVARVHQNVLVFYKGDPTKIKSNFPKIELPEIEEEEEQ